MLLAARLPYAAHPATLLTRNAMRNRPSSPSFVASWFLTVDVPSSPSLGGRFIHWIMSGQPRQTERIGFRLELERRLLGQ